MKYFLLVFFYFPFVYSLGLLLGKVNNKLNDITETKHVYYVIATLMVSFFMSCLSFNSIYFFISIFIVSCLLIYCIVKSGLSKNRTIYAIIVVLFLQALYSCFYIYSINKQFDIKENFYSQSLINDIKLKECGKQIICYSGEQRHLQNTIHAYDKLSKTGIIDQESSQQIISEHEQIFKEFISINTFFWLFSILLLNLFHKYIKKNTINLKNSKPNKFLDSIVFEQIEVAVMGVGVLLIVFHYIPYLANTEFLRSNITTFSYMFIESIYNGISLLLLFIMLSNRLRALDIFFFFSIGLIIAYFHLFDLQHDYMNNHNLYPNFLVTKEENNVPSSQYSRIIMINGLAIISFSLLLWKKSFLKIISSSYVLGYFIFFAIGHVYILKLYSNYRIQESEHIHMLLKNYDQKNCEYLGSQCEVIHKDNINNLEIKKPFRKVEFPRFKSLEQPRNELLEELQTFVKNDSKYYYNLDTTLVRESFKYAFLKDDKDIKVFIDTKEMSRGADFYIFVFNILNLIFLTIWGWMYIKIKKIHAKKGIN